MKAFKLSETIKAVRVVTGIDIPYYRVENIVGRSFLLRRPLVEVDHLSHTMLVNDGLDTTDYKELDLVGETVYIIQQPSPPPVINGHQPKSDAIVKATVVQVTIRYPYAVEYTVDNGNHKCDVNTVYTKEEDVTNELNIHRMTGDL